MKGERSTLPCSAVLHSSNFTIHSSRACARSVLPRGLEPPRACAHWILNPARLPIPPQEHTTPAQPHAPGEIRTPDLLIRSQALYPAELRAHNHVTGFVRGANAPGRNRTYNLGIKSPLLCQLSYRCVGEQKEKSTRFSRFRQAPAGPPLPSPGPPADTAFTRERGI